MTEITLRDGKIATMSELQAAFESMLDAHNVLYLTCNRKAVKQLLQAEIPGIEFHKAKRVNESDRVSIKKIRDSAIQLAEDNSADVDTNMKTLFDAATILRKSIKNARSGSLLDL